MKNDKLWRIIWIVGIYAILGVLLYLVILYKVEWEHKDLNTYLYFYNCNHELCSSINHQDDYYSKFLCEDDICPSIKSIDRDNLVLQGENSSWIYNYVNGEVVASKYKNYRYIGDNLYVVTNDNQTYGVVDINGELLADLNYSYIVDYDADLQLLSYKKMMCVHIFISCVLRVSIGLFLSHSIESHIQPRTIR